MGKYSIAFPFSHIERLFALIRARICIEINVVAKLLRNLRWDNDFHGQNDI